MTPADPLAQLRDIHLPDPISAWPPGPGWWLLAVLLACTLIAAFTWWLRRHRANAWRRQARSALNVAYRQYRLSEDEIAYLQEMNEILKRAALQQFPREEVARLSGSNWEAFLDAQWRKVPDTAFTRLEFADCAYRPGPGGVDIEALHRLGRRWVKQLRVAPC
jgi:hypothetical protein